MRIWRVLLVLLFLGEIGFGEAVQEKLDYQLSIIEEKERILDINHPSLASSYTSVLLLYMEIGDFNSAKKYALKALDIRIALNRGDLDLAVAYNNVYAVYDELRDYNKALEYALKALELKKIVLEENKNDPQIHIFYIDLAESYNKISKVYKELGNFNKAIGYVEKTIEIEERFLDSNSPDLADTYDDVMVLYAKINNLKKAEKYVFKALDIREKVLGKKHPDTAISYNNIAGLYSDLGDKNRAKEYYFKALKIQEEVLEKNHPKLALSYTNIAVIYIELGKYHKAKEYAFKGLNIRKEIFDKSHPSLAISYHNISKIYEYLGDLLTAKEYALKSLIIQEKILDKNHPHLASSYSNLLSLYQALGDLEKAKKYALKALELRERVLDKSHPDLALAYGNLADIYHRLGDFDRYKEYLFKALDIFDEVLNRKDPLLAKIYSRVSQYYGFVDDYKRALEYSFKALKIREEVLDINHPDLADSYLVLGSLYKSLKDYKEALKYAFKSLDINKKVLGESHPDLINDYMNIFFIYGVQKDFVNGYKYLKKLVELRLEQRKISFSILNNSKKYKNSDSTKIEMLTLFSMLFDRNFLPLKSTEEIIAHMNDSIDIWIEYKGEITDSQNMLLKLKEQSKDIDVKNMIDELYKVNQEYSNLYFLDVSYSEKLKKLQEKLDLLKKRKENLEEELSSRVYAFRKEQKLQDIKAYDVAKLLKDGEVYIDYAYFKRSSFIFVIDNRRNYFFMLDKFDLNEDRGTLYNKLLKNKIGDELKNYKKLIISKDGILHKIPFESLFNKETGKYLIEEKEITYVPSAKEFVRLHNMKNKNLGNSKKIVLFANPNFKMALSDKREKYRGDEEIKKLQHLPTFSTLNGFKKEAEAIERIFPNQTYSYMWDYASEENLFKIKSPKILHFATHGFFVNDENLSFSNIKSGIALSGYNVSILDGKSYKGIVTASKLFHLDLSGTELVVFSACDTGVGDMHNAEGVDGLNKAVIQAGANRVLMSLWRVDDKMTVKFMTYFYQYLKEGRAYAKALRDTKLRMIKENIEPKHWSAFVLNGID